MSWFTRRIFKGIALIALVVPLSPPAYSEPPVCESLQACLDELATPPANGDKGMSSRDQEVAKHLQGYGRAAVEPLLDLLQAANPKVRDRAGYTLRDMEMLTEDDLPALQAAMFGGNGWIAPAVARVGTPDAIRSLVENLRRDGSVPNQTTGALARLGGKAVPYLLEAYACIPRCASPQFQRALAAVFDEMGSAAASAVAPLVTTANDSAQPLALRVAALEALAAIGPEANAHGESLRPLLKSPQRKLAQAAAAALLSIGDGSAVGGLLDKLDVEKTPGGRWSLIRGIASLGGAGSVAGPRLQALLLDPSPWVAAAAAEALGWIGDEEATPHLLAATHSQHWLLVYQAAWSLGRLRAAEAREPLSQLRDGHWSYPVRTVAAQALEALDKPPEPPEAGLRRIIDHFQDVQRHIHEAPVCEGDVAWRGERLQLQDQAVWPPAPFTNSWPRFIPADARAVFPVDDGWLVGLDQGEFGGGLFHYSRAGRERVILKDAPIGGIYRASSGLVATEGVDHMMYRPGNVYRLVRSGNGSWQAQPLVTLQAAPRKTAMAQDGTLIVQSRGAVVAITQGGALEGAACVSGDAPESLQP